MKTLARNEDDSLNAFLTGAEPPRNDLAAMVQEGAAAPVAGAQQSPAKPSEERGKVSAEGLSVAESHEMPEAFGIDADVAPEAAQQTANQERKQREQQAADQERKQRQYQTAEFWNTCRSLYLKPAINGGMCSKVEAKGPNVIFHIGPQKDPIAWLNLNVMDNSLSVKRPLSDILKPSKLNEVEMARAMLEAGRRMGWKTMTFKGSPEFMTAAKEIASKMEPPMAVVDNVTFKAIRKAQEQARDQAQSVSERHIDPDMSTRP